MQTKKETKRKKKMIIEIKVTIQIKKEENYITGEWEC